MNTILDLIKNVSSCDPENKRLYDILESNSYLQLNTKLVDFMEQVIRANSQPIFNYLLERNININEFNTKTSMSPITYAAWCGRYKMTRKLVECNASINDNVKDKKSALYYSLVSPKLKIEKIIILNVQKY